MTTVASPVSIREQALEVIASIIGPSASTRRLGEIGAAVAVDLLIALERRFDIAIDADEVLPNGTVGVLSHLVELRAEAAEAAERAGRIYHWDDERARRALPHYSPRPRLVEVPRAPDADLAPPAWPDVDVEPTYLALDHVTITRPMARKLIEIAAPAPEAWALASKLYARERRERAALLALTLVGALIGVGGFAVWLHTLGVV